MSTGAGAPSRVQPLGVFGGMTRLDREALERAVGGLSAAEAARVAAYLRAGHPVLALMEHTVDVLHGRFGVAGGSAVVTDGTYHWRLDAAEYVATYCASVPDAAVRHMAERGWRVPDLSEQVLLGIDDYLTGG